MVLSGTVSLWAGWSLRLPSQCVVERNADGSWSAWDDTKAVDIHIIEVGGHVSGEPMSADDMLGAPATARGEGWVGTTELHEEAGESGPIMRLALSAAATNTYLSCWVGYREHADAAWADDVVRSVRHQPST